MDAHATEWASPAGFVALLTLGQALAELGAPKPELTLPAAKITSYWAKAGLLRHAETLFDLHGAVPNRQAAETSDVLVPVTIIRNAADVMEIVGRITEQATRFSSMSCNSNRASWAALDSRCPRRARTSWSMPAPQDGSRCTCMSIASDSAAERLP